MRRGRGIELLEDLGDLLVREPLEQHRDLARLELRDEVRPFRRADAIGQAADAVAFAFADELEQLVTQSIGSRACHGDLPLRARGPWRTEEGRPRDAMPASRIAIVRRPASLVRTAVDGAFGWL